jgi:hypothetical protein
MRLQSDLFVAVHRAAPVEHLADGQRWSFGSRSVADADVEIDVSETAVRTDQPSLGSHVQRDCRPVESKRYWWNVSCLEKSSSRQCRVDLAIADLRFAGGFEQSLDEALMQSGVIGANGELDASRELPPLPRLCLSARRALEEEEVPPLRHGACQILAAGSSTSSAAACPVWGGAAEPFNTCRGKCSRGLVSWGPHGRLPLQ